MSKIHTHKTAHFALVVSNVEDPRLVRVDSARSAFKAEDALAAETGGELTQYVRGESARLRAQHAAAEDTRKHRDGVGDAEDAFDAAQDALIALGVHTRAVLVEGALHADAVFARWEGERGERIWALFATAYEAPLREAECALAALKALFAQ